MGTSANKVSLFKNGIAINPQVEDIKDYSTTDRARFEEMPKYQRLDEVFKFEHPYPEIKVTPEIRQRRLREICNDR